MHLVIIADPAHELKVAMDTTLLVAAECNRRGHQVFYGTPRQLFLDSKGPALRGGTFDYRHADPRKPQDCLGPEQQRLLDEFDVILMRQDPPVDEKYVSITHILDFCTKPVVNSPRDVAIFSEKISVLRLPHLSPASLISIDPAIIESFVNEFEHGCVLKPLNLFNGTGVLRLKRGDPEIFNLVKTGTVNFTKFVIAQEFVPAVSEGDKRVFLLDGAPIGRMNRVPAAGEWRANIHLGAVPQKFDLSERDALIVEEVARLLADYDLPIYCIDIIGDYLTEINVTSPSGIPEINRIYGDGHEGPIVDYLERRAACGRAKPRPLELG